MISSAITSGAVFLISLLQVLPVAAVPAASNQDSPIPGYVIEEIVWEIQTSPGGPTVNVTGTVQDVIRYAEKVNPNFRSDFALDQPSKVSSNDGHGRYEPYFWDCKHQKDAKLGLIEDGIKYLRGVPGRPAMGPAPFHCGRVSCDWGAAIFWCTQDSLGDKVLDSFASIADGAQSLVDTCKPYHTLTKETRGEVYFKDNWSVVVTNLGKCS